MIVWFFAPETVDPILSKEPDVTRGLRKHLRGQRASERASPTNPRDRLHEAGWFGMVTPAGSRGRL